MLGLGGSPMPSPEAMGPTGPAAPSSPNLGAQAQAMAKVAQAVQLLQLQLPELQVGSDEHKTVLKAITDLSKIAPPDSIPSGVQMSSINQVKEDAGKTAMLRLLLNSGGGAAPAAPAPAGPPGTLPGFV